MHSTIHPSIHSHQSTNPCIHPSTHQTNYLSIYPPTPFNFHFYHSSQGHHLHDTLFPCLFGFFAFIFTHSSKNLYFRPVAGIISLKCQQVLGSPHLEPSYDPYPYDVIQNLYLTHDSWLSNHCSLSDLSLITVHYTLTTCKIFQFLQHTKNSLA